MDIIVGTHLQLAPGYLLSESMYYPALELNYNHTQSHSTMHSICSTTVVGKLGKSRLGWVEVVMRPFGEQEQVNDLRICSWFYISDQQVGRREIGDFSKWKDREESELARMLWVDVIGECYGGELLWVITCVTVDLFTFDSVATFVIINIYKCNHLFSLFVLFGIRRCEPNKRYLSN